MTDARPAGASVRLIGLIVLLAVQGCAHIPPSPLPESLQQQLGKTGVVGTTTQQHGSDFPQDPYKQLELATEAVFKSWNGKRAVDYRRATNIPDDLGTAVNIQTMVFGNMGEDSGTGVAFTRDPSTGERKMFGEYLLNAQGEDVVAGIRNAEKIENLNARMPEAYRQFMQITGRLEMHYTEMQDVEFTIEHGKLWMLQTRNGKRTAKAAVKIAVDMANEGPPLRPTRAGPPPRIGPPMFAKRGANTAKSSSSV